MSKKSLTPLEDPPTASSSDDDEVETESETGSDSESKQAVTVTVASAVNPKKKEAAQSKSGTKRPKEGSSRDTNAKRSKIVEDVKKPAFTRLWSEEDEIAVLQGMIDFNTDSGKSPYEDSNGFYEIVKKVISFEVSKNQFMDKIRSLKKKYVGKGKKGVEASFLKAHDQQCYDLCKLIWGSEGIMSDVKTNVESTKKNKLDSVKLDLSFVASPNGKKKVEDDNKVLIHGGEVEEAVRKHDWFENSFLVRSIAGLGADDHYVKQNWSLVPVETKKKIEEKLKVLQAKEMEFVLEKTDFVHEVASLINEMSKKKPQDIQI